jgi:hypothetical protein
MSQSLSSHGLINPLPPPQLSLRKYTILTFDYLFTYMRGLYGPRNLQHVSILKGCEPKKTFPNYCAFKCLACLRSYNIS